MKRHVPIDHFAQIKIFIILVKNLAIKKQFVHTEYRLVLRLLLSLSDLVIDNIYFLRTVF